MVQQYHQQHEPFYYFVNGANVTWNGGGSGRTVFEMGRESDGSHPTMKPTELFEKLIENHSSKDEIVYDPFLGSGTVGLVAQKHGRDWLGCDISLEYCNIVISRLMQKGETTAGMFLDL